MHRTLVIPAIAAACLSLSANTVAAQDLDTGDDFFQDSQHSSYVLAQMHVLNLQWCQKAQANRPGLADAGLDGSAFDALEQRLGELVSDWDPDQIETLDSEARRMLDDYHDDMLDDALLSEPRAFAAFCNASHSVGMAYTAPEAWPAASGL